MANPKRIVQAFVELRSADPEATSALAAARERLAAGRALQALRRMRVFEIAGSTLDAGALARRLHGSTQFYNPARERCVLRADAGEPVPAADEEALVLVFERGGERRAPVERWWRHEGGERVEVREGVIWALTFAPGEDGAARAAELAMVTSRAEGLFANPHVQDHRVCAGSTPPLDWMSRKVAPTPRRGRRAT